MNKNPQWDYMPFEDITKPVDKSGPNEGEVFDYIEIGSINNQTKTIDEVRRITSDEASSRASRRLKSGDVLISRTRPNLNGVAIVPERFDGAIGTSGFYVVRSESVISKFVYYYAQTREFINDMTERATGSSYPSVNLSKIRPYEVPVPPKSEQQKIVERIEELLSKLEAGRSAIRDVRERLDPYRMALLKKAISGEFNEQTGENALSDSRNYSTANDGQLPSVPDSWDIVPFEDILSESLRNGKSAKAAKSQDGIRTLTLSAVTDRDFSEQNTKITVADPEEVEDLWLEPGDILIERSNTEEYVGLAALFKGQRDYAIYPDLMVRIRVDTEIALPRYIEYVLRSPFARNYFRRNSKGTSGSMAKINQDHIREFPFPLPPLSEQEEIIERLEKYDTAIEDLEKTVSQSENRAKNLRAKILQKAFNGELVGASKTVQTDEPHVTNQDKLIQATLPDSTKTGDNYE